MHDVILVSDYISNTVDIMIENIHKPAADFILVFQYLEGVYREDRSPVLTRSHMEKGQRVPAAPGKMVFCYEKDIFYGESNPLQAQAPLGHGRKPVTGIFNIQWMG